MRGLSAGFAGNQSSAAIAPFPNVATLSRRPVDAVPGAQCRIYMADMERIEVLEGPQGTLFGGGAEAGAIRYITNKPKLNVTEGNVEASYGITAARRPEHRVNASLNVPLIADTLAVRAVIYRRSPRRLHRQRAEQIHALQQRSRRHYAVIRGAVACARTACRRSSQRLCVPANSAIANNYALAQRTQTR